MLLIGIGLWSCLRAQWPGFPSHHFVNGDVFKAYGATAILQVDSAHPAAGSWFDAYMEDGNQPVDSIQITVGIETTPPGTEEKVLRSETFSSGLPRYGAHIKVGHVVDPDKIRIVWIKTLKIVDEQEYH
jgi:hypothetical protein